MDEKIHRNVTPITVLQRSRIVDTDNVSQPCILAKQSCILLVTRGSRLAEPVMDYAVNVADRMKCKILASYVNTLPLFGNGDVSHRQFASAIEQNAIEFREKAIARGVDFEYVQESGKISKIISRLCRIVKRIEFVLIDQGIKIEEAAFGSPVPVFNIVCTDTRTGEMVENRPANKKLSEERQHEHGSLFSNFLSALGIKSSKVTAGKKAEKSKSVDKQVQVREQTCVR